MFYEPNISTHISHSFRQVRKKPPTVEKHQILSKYVQGVKTEPRETHTTSNRAKENVRNSLIEVQYINNKSDE